MKYIGARYMPKFLGTYDPTTAYEALSVVDNGMGTSYVCSKPTPAGTPLTDSEYWVQYGTSSGAILALQQQIDDMNDGSVSGSLQNQIDANTSDIAMLENISIPANRQFIIIGDSYGMRNNPNYLSLLTSRFPNNIRGTALSSYSFIPFNLTGKWFKDILDDYYTTLMTAAERAEITDIVVLGGWNDAHRIALGEADVNSILGKIQEFINHATQYFPNCKVWIGFVGWQTRWALDNVPAGETYPTFSNLRTAELAYSNFVYPNGYVLDTPRYVMRDPNNYDNTFFHPNGEGGNRLAYSIIGELMGHHSYNRNYSIAITDLDDSGVITALTNCDVSICNDRTSFRIYATVNGSLTDNIICTFADNKTIGTTEDTAIWCDCLFDGTLNGSSYRGPLFGQISDKLRLYTPGIHTVTSIDGRFTIVGSVNNKYNF